MIPEIVSEPVVRPRKVKVVHPEFQRVSYPFDCDLKEFDHIVIFERSEWIKPTPEQVAKYREDEEIVDDHGGVMRLAHWQVGGKNKPFTSAEVDAMIEAVKDQNPDHCVVKSWNGVGGYTLSVAIKGKF